MDGTAIAVAAVVGAAAGFLAPRVADAVATPRYGPGAEGHDPDDVALAPLAAPSSPAVHLVATLAGAGSFAAIAASLASGDGTAVFAGVAWVCIVASVVDLQYLRLPNVLTYGGAAAALVAIAAVAVRRDVTDSIVGAVVGALVYAGMLLAVSELFRMVLRRTGLGLGDVKLALALGATVGWLGWRSDLAVLGPVSLVIYAALFGNLLGVAGGLLLTRFQPNRSFPFGPFLAVGWLVTVVLHDTLALEG